MYYSTSVCRIVWIEINILDIDTAKPAYQPYSYLSYRLPCAKPVFIPCGVRSFSQEWGLAVSYNDKRSRSLWLLVAVRYDVWWSVVAGDLCRSEEKKGC